MPSNFKPMMFQDSFIKMKKLQRLKKFQLSYEEFYKLSLFAKSKKLKFISTPFDLTSVEKIKKFVDYFKILRR